MSQSKVEKRVNKWRKSNQNIPKGDLNMVLDYYFPGCWRHGVPGGGSHEYVVEHELFQQFPNCMDGMLHIPVKGGKQVRPRYLKILIIVIDQIRENQ